MMLIFLFWTHVGDLQTVHFIHSIGLFECRQPLQAPCPQMTGLIWACNWMLPCLIPFFENWRHPTLFEYICGNTPVINEVLISRDMTGQIALIVDFSWPLVIPSGPLLWLFFIFLMIFSTCLIVTSWKQNLVLAGVSLDRGSHVVCPFNLSLSWWTLSSKCSFILLAASDCPPSLAMNWDRSSGLFLPRSLLATL